MSSEERPDSLAAQAAAWVPPWERRREPDREFPETVAASAPSSDDISEMSGKEAGEWPADPEPESTSEPEAAADPVIEADPVAEADPVIEADPVAEPEPEVDVEAERGAGPEPVAGLEVERKAELEPVAGIEAERGADRELMIEADPVAEPEPVVDVEVERGAGPELMAGVEAEREAEPELMVEVVQVAGPEPVAGVEVERGAQRESMVEVGPVAEHEAEVEAEAGVVPEHVLQGGVGVVRQPDVEEEGPELPRHPLAGAYAPVPAQQRRPRGPVAEVAAPVAVMDEGELAAALESIMLVVDEPVGELQLAQVLEQPVERIARTLENVSARYTAAGHGIDLRRVAGGWRLYTRPEYATYVERFVLDGQSVRLTQAALETLAVVAYKQPVTRSRISAIRGVNCDGVMRTLVTRGLIEECGTEPETGAYLYRTTPLFLEKLGLNSVDQLPPLAPFLPDDVEEVLDASG